MRSLDLVLICKHVLKEGIFYVYEKWKGGCLLESFRDF